MKTQSIKLDKIVTDAGTQVRAAIDENTVSQYADSMQDGDTFPAVVLFDDGNRLILADGFHRVMAAVRCGFKDILSEVRKGTRSDALKHALVANSTHGLRRSNADKRRSVELALAEWPKLSTAEIARICAVSRPQVDAVRNEHAESACCETKTRTGSDGKERKLPVKKEKTEPEPEQSPEPEPQHNADPVNMFKEVGTMEAGEPEREERTYTIDDLRRDRDNIVADMVHWTDEALKMVDLEFTMPLVRAARNEMKRRIK